MPIDTTNFIDFIDRVAKAPDVESIWLFGSQANGTARLDSDWDLIAFGSEATIDFLSKATQLHEPNVDFFVVIDGDNFKAAWGQLDKSGSLAEWEWAKISATEAKYLATKAQQSGADVLLSRACARKIWPTKKS